MVANKASKGLFLLTDILFFRFNDIKMSHFEALWSYISFVVSALFVNFERQIAQRFGSAV
jgi:hypothetical protein